MHYNDSMIMVMMPAVVMPSIKETTCQLDGKNDTEQYL
jgi:hypothetical protein